LTDDSARLGEDESTQPRFDKAKLDESIGNVLRKDAVRHAVAYLADSEPLVWGKIAGVDGRVAHHTLAPLARARTSSLGERNVDWNAFRLVNRLNIGTTIAPTPA
jgi:hypothetical protein